MASRPPLQSGRQAAGGAERPPASPRTTGAGHAGGETIEQCIVRSLNEYFDNLGGAKPHALHEMVVQAAERPLLKFAIERTNGNQSAAAELLGINRNTLRKKLTAYRLG
ncbi:MAG: Fis family transcriptional regulator [Burkholderiales bacterium]|jgi:Fis family transcriptional regulator|nr:MAG: Fis family transcriptional regulator [Burkholderiales bacterium]